MSFVTKMKYKPPNNMKRLKLSVTPTKGALYTEKIASNAEMIATSRFLEKEYDSAAVTGTTKAAIIMKGNFAEAYVA